MKKFTTKINEHIDRFGHSIDIGDKALVPNDLTTDPANRQGQYGEVVHITKNGDLVLEFEDGGIAVYQEGVLDVSED